MPNDPLCFVHASDLRLDQSIHGLSAIPDHLRDVLRDAAHLAAENVFDVACDEAADFLILTGDVVGGRHASARSIVFLLDQFRRLAQRAITVYWATGPLDLPETWPGEISLPDNVVRFPSQQTELRLHVRSEQAIAEVLGVSRFGSEAIAADRFQPTRNDLFSIGVAFGEVDQAQLDRQAVDYLALGGRSTRQTLRGSARLAHYAGIPQALRPEDRGTRGCTVVQVNASRHAHLRNVATDVLRWHEERIEIEVDDNEETLQPRLARRAKAIVDDADGRVSLVRWVLSGTAEATAPWRYGARAVDLLEWLQVEFGYAAPALWSAGVDVEPPDRWPAPWMEQETILGDYLRLVRNYEQDEALSLDLSCFVTPGAEADLACAATSCNRPGDRRRVLGEAAALGVELLSGSGRVDRMEEAR